jgi:transcriptional regulator with XRE-family HTH domain
MDAFVEYLRNAIRAAGYSTPTQFAREAELDPSVVLRWLGGTQRPTVRSLERVAPLLGRSTAEMVRAAYPDRVGDDGTGGPLLHHLGYEVGRLLGEDSPIPQDERRMLEKFLNTMLEPYRQNLRPRRTRRPAATEARTSPEPAAHHGHALRVAD